MNHKYDHRRQEVQQIVKNASDQLNQEGVDARNYVEQLAWLFFLKAFDEAEARRDFENTLDGPDAEQLALLEGQFESAKAQVAAAEKSLSNYDLTAPFDGTIVDVNVTINEMIGPENWAVIIADFSEFFVETNDLTELKVVKVFEGQEATIVPDALPDLEITGHVEEINQGFYVQGGDISYRVKLSLVETDPQIRWGMTVEITFESAE